MSALDTYCADNTPSNPTLRVTIIAINKFDDKNLADKDLTDAIDNNARELEEYFKTTFLVSPKMITGDHATDADIREWLLSELPVDSEKTINLIFILTHGFPNPGNNEDSNDSEIYLAASNTSEDRPTRNSITGMQLVEAIKHAPKRNAFFLFIDACGSGAIDGDELEQVLQSDRDLASRLMILASSAPDEKSYRARFTQALLQIWKNKNADCSVENPESCHCGSSIEAYLTQKIKELPGVDPNVEQNIQLVSQDFPDFCIELFGAEQRLLFLFNAAPGMSEVTLLTPTTQFKPPMKMKKDTTRPVNLNARDYIVVAKRLYSTSKRKEVIPFNFKKAPVDIEVLFGTELDKAEATQAVGLFLQQHEIAPAVGVQLRLKASAEFQQLDRKAKINALNAKEQLDKLAVQRSSEQAEASKAKNLVDEASKAVPYPVLPPANGYSYHGCPTYDAKCLEHPQKDPAIERFDAASGVYDQKVKAVRDIDKQVSAVTATISKLSFQVKKLTELRSIGQQFDEMEVWQEGFRNELVRDAQERWTKNIVINNRGINLFYPQGPALAEADVQRIVDFVNRYNFAQGSAQLEIEIPVPQKSPKLMDETGDEDDIAKNIQRQLKAKGLNSIPTATRTFLSSHDDENIRIIISPYYRF